MRNIPCSKPVLGKALNTLAQNGTNNLQDNGAKCAAVYAGAGSELGNDKAMKGRAKRKTIGQALALSLIDIAIKKGNEERFFSLWNTWRCQNRLVTIDGRYYGKYCKTRICPICNSIRKADIINRYLPILQTWAEPYFVTLTIKACKADKLNGRLKAMIRAMKQIIGKHRKANQRGGGIKLIGIKSLECNFNPVTKTYNPHFHLIVPDKETANTIMSEWLKKWTVHFASGSGQDKRPVTDLQRCLIEVIKYGSKIFTEPDIYKKVKGVSDRDIYAAALYNIIDAMDGLRIFERFGFNLSPESRATPAGVRVAEKYDEWVYVPEFHDWLNTENELTLTGFSPQAELINLLKYNIRTDLE